MIENHLIRQQTSSIQNHPEITAQFRTSPEILQSWFKELKMKGNNTKSAYMTFTFIIRYNSCLSIFLINYQIPQTERAKYLKIYLDGKFSWKHFIMMKGKQLKLLLFKIFVLMSHKFPVSLDNTLFMYKTILTPVLISRFFQKSFNFDLKN